MTTGTSVTRTRAAVGSRLPHSAHCLIMGILNVTPDSFSDGGRYIATNDAVRHGLTLARDGADIIDIGGESTRPGARRITESEELQRVLPVVSALAQVGMPVTIDTMRSRVAAAAVAAGAVGVNDVSGGLADPQMAVFIAEARVPYILTHWRAPSIEMANHAVYDDVVADVVTELRRRLAAFERAGADLDQIIIDPGLGFAKTAQHNWQLLNRLHELNCLARPVLIGASRKSFLRKLIGTGGPDGDSFSSRELDTASAAVSALAAAAGAYCVRVHDVKSSAAAIKMSAAWMAGSEEPTHR